MTDARRVAGSLIHRIRARAPHLPVVAFGTARRMDVAVGERACFGVADGVWERREGGRRVGSGDDRGPVWDEIGRFLDDHVGEPVFGFLGYDLHRGTEGALRPGPGTSTYLMVPDGVVELDGEGAPVVTGEADGWRDTLDQVHRIDDLDPPPDRVVEASASGLEAFRTQVVRTLRWIGPGGGGRATIAAPVELPFLVDMAGSLPGPVPAGRASLLSRSFYASVGRFELVGTSPELLATGSTSGFTSYKLSGTYPLPPAGPSPAPAVEADWSGLFLADERISSEHASSVSTLVDSLARLGTCAAAPREVLVLHDLLHLLTELTTRPAEGATVLDCVRSVFPSGVAPFPEAMSVVADMEDEGRGAYYGLIGRVDRSGRFDWAQVLRATFRLGDRRWVSVGAAVTALSTPALESEEVALKCRSVHVRPAATPNRAGDGAGSGAGVVRRP